MEWNSILSCNESLKMLIVLRWLGEFSATFNSRLGWRFQFRVKLPPTIAQSSLSHWLDELENTWMRSHSSHHDSNRKIPCDFGSIPSEHIPPPPPHTHTHTPVNTFHIKSQSFLISILKLWAGSTSQNKTEKESSSCRKRAWGECMRELMRHGSWWVFLQRVVFYTAMDGAKWHGTWCDEIVETFIKEL